MPPVALGGTALRRSGRQVSFSLATAEFAGRAPAAVPDAGAREVAGRSLEVLKEPIDNCGRERRLPSVGADRRVFPSGGAVRRSAALRFQTELFQATGTSLLERSRTIAVMAWWTSRPRGSKTWLGGKMHVLMHVAPQSSLPGCSRPGQPDAHAKCAGSGCSTATTVPSRSCGSCWVWQAMVAASVPEVVGATAALPRCVQRWIPYRQWSPSQQTVRDTSRNKSSSCERGPRPPDE